MTSQLAAATVAQDQFAGHDLLMYEYYNRNPPYEPQSAVLVQSEEGQMVALHEECDGGA